jgi:transcriptional regulator of acetoin/glycerol metabolism
MAEAQTPSGRVEQARELFFAQGRDPGEAIAPHIERSWRRSRVADQAISDPAPMALQQLRERREQAIRLLECAQPELDGLTEHALGHGCVVILSDASGLILDEIGSPDFLPKAQRVALTPGVEWSEANRGTNAIGTALMERQALMVLGREHYLPQNGALGCAAAPIFTGRGDIAGVLDISGEAVHVNNHALGLVRMAAQQVEHRMMVAEANGHLLRFHRKPGLLGTPREGLVIIDDGQVVAANRVALALLDEQWQGLLGQPAERLLGSRWARLEKHAGLLTLPGGLQMAASVERSTHDAGRRWASARPALVARPPLAQRVPATTEDDTVPLAERAMKVLNQGVPVLVMGETGCGKEVFARRLHRSGRRSGGPFVAVNCAALPETLIEAELFGYEEGAFTGARRRGVPGRIREAHGGVLFLDEIGDMPVLLQTRLLRVLEERVVTPLGSGHGVAVDFDLVCATHRDLTALAAAGQFRSDLLYRVNGFTVALPALRDRRDKRALIARLFDEAGAAAKRLSLAEAAEELLAEHRWPGNVRELCSVLRSVVALADVGDIITTDRLPAALHLPAAAVAPQGRSARPNDANPGHPVDQAIAECDGNVLEAARRLGVHRSTIYRHLAQQRRP